GALPTSPGASSATSRRRSSPRRARPWLRRKPAVWVRRPDMHFADLFRIALRSLARSKMRTFLTMLGVIIGVAAVIAMLAVGRGAGDTMKSSIASLGTNAINVYPGSRSQGPARLEAGAASRFREDDVQAVGKEAAALLYITPVARTQAQLKTGGENWRTS